MSKKKLTTQEILAAARAQAGQKSQDAGNGPAASPPADSPETTADAPAPAEDGPASAQASSEAPAPAEETPRSTPGPSPKSTKDILAAARAQAAGGAKPATSPKPAAAGGGPKSTKDILAAARAQAGGGQPAAPAAKPKPAAKPAGKAATAAVAAGAANPAGTRPSVQEMLKAVREGKPKETIETAPAPARPRVPKKPQVVRKREEKVSRRRFLWLTAAIVFLATPFYLAWILFAGTSTVFLLGVARFMFPNVLVEPPSTFKIGPPGEYPFGTVATKLVPQFGIWVVHTEYRGRAMIYALSTVCTHLGCTPNWLEGEQKFKCPCHGSGFYITGINFEGPAPRPLERHGLRIAEDGMLEVDKSVKFQEELGQWDDPASFVEVV